MQKYKYGPLIYVIGGMDDDEGNYFWAGLPPVGYDEYGVPIDKNGNQCLDISCPLHPGFEPTETVFSEVLQFNIPSIEYFRKWFEDNFLIISDDQVKRYIIRWWSVRAKRENFRSYTDVLQNYSSVEEIQEAVWPDEPQS